MYVHVVEFIIYQWLEEHMMGYLEKWKKSVTQREGYKDLKNAQNMMLLPLKTQKDIQIIGIYTNICNIINSYLHFAVKPSMEIVRYLFNIPGVELFYSNRLCQDSLENFLDKGEDS